MRVFSRTWPETFCIAKEGGSANGKLANWELAQIAQKSANPVGFDGVTGAAGNDAEDWSSELADNSAVGPKSPAICTCPKDNASWIVSAKIAHQEPERMFDRNQVIKLQAQIQGQCYIST